MSLRAPAFILRPPNIVLMAMRVQESGSVYAVPFTARAKWGTSSNGTWTVTRTGRGERPKHQNISSPKMYGHEQSQWISALGTGLHPPSNTRLVKPIEWSEKGLTKGRRVREGPKPINTLGFAQNNDSRGNRGSSHWLLVNIATARIDLRKFRTYS
jgi:hypothetical protein